MEALRDRQADVAVTTLDQAVHGGWIRDVPVRVVVAHTRAPATALLVAPGARETVRGVADLRGRPVGIPGPGTTGHLLLISLLRQARVDPGRVDVRSVAGPAAAGRLAAGEVVAAVVDEPWASRLVDAGAATILVDFRRPEETARLLGGPFHEFVSVARAKRPPAPREKGKPPPPEPPAPPPDAALAAFARALARVQTWLATAPVDALAERLVPTVVRDAGRATALRALYAGDGEATAAGLAATLRVLRLGTPWPVSLRLEAEDLLAIPAVSEARRALGPTPPPP
jgi:ABC-type nitrate/sulfonate/bicarbonate transport system substrate-binding protein